MQKPKASRNKAKDVSPKKVKDMSVVELKALAYDIFALIQRNQNELRQVNDLIQERTNGHGKVGEGKPKTKEGEPETEKPIEGDKKKK